LFWEEDAVDLVILVSTILALIVGTLLSVDGVLDNGF
jgi:hypothetical protein